MGYRSLAISRKTRNLVGRLRAASQFVPRLVTTTGVSVLDRKVRLLVLYHRAYHSTGPQPEPRRLPEIAVLPLGREDTWRARLMGQIPTD